MVKEFVEKNVGGKTRLFVVEEGRTRPATAWERINFITSKHLTGNVVTGWSGNKPPGAKRQRRRA